MFGNERGDPVPRTDSEPAQRRRQSGNLRDECLRDRLPRGALILTHRNQTRPTDRRSRSALAGIVHSTTGKPLAPGIDREPSAARGRGPEIPK